MANPRSEDRNLVAFALTFGFRHAQDLDQHGKNIFHHLFSSIKYSGLSGEVALNSFGENHLHLPGNYREAMRHKVTSGKPIGWTPLHCLCNNSDYLMLNSKLIEVLLQTKTVKITDFDSVQNPDVTVFWECCWGP